MLVGRRNWLLMAVAVGLAGCRTGGTGSLSLMPRRNPTPSTFNVDDFVADHNRNAALIESLQAKPSIDVSSGRLYRVNVNGRMALERPRNFKLELEAQGVRQADLGSNAEEFWFWMANAEKDRKWIYWCNYRDLPSSDLPVTYQPDWIIEAMGLQPITPQEAAGIRIGRGTESNTTVLNFPATRDHGSAYSREMVVSNADRRIKRLRIYSESPRVLLAESQSDDYRAHPTGTPGSSSRENCYLPNRLKLQWKREQLVLDVKLDEVTVNQFDHAMAADLFVEPEQQGYTRLNLAELSRTSRPDRRTRTRQTIPPPESSDDVQLGRPSSLKDGDSAAPRVGARSTRAARASDDGPLPTLDELVGTPVARPPAAGSSESASVPGIPGRDSTNE